MNNPLNELSAVYQQNIAEDCECDDKKKKELEKAEMLPQGKTPMGGDGARPGKNRKAYVEPMSYEGYAPGDVDQKVGAVTSIPKKDQDAARERILAKAKAKREAMKEGHCDVEGVECSPTEKKKDTKKNVKEHVSWRDELREVSVGYNVANRENAVTTKPQNSDDSRKEVTEKKIKNKVRINPPQGVTEGFKEIGGVIIEMYEITEKIDLKKADMGEVIKDFRKSDAPQFKGKSDKKKQQMAIAAKLQADEGFVPPYDELKTVKNEKEKKAKQLQQQTKDHDDQMSGKMASEETINELNRYEKETGTSSGSMNMPKGRPTQKGGDSSPAMRAVRQMMRSQTGKPEGQRKPSERVQRPTGMTPAQKVQKRRADKKKAQDNMSSRFD